MVKADLGTKRVCPSCGTRFYDLSKRPITCPKCGSAFEPEALFKQRRARQNETEEKPETENEEIDTELENDEDLVEAEDGHGLAEAGEDETPHRKETDHTAAGMSVVDADDVTIEDIDDDAVEEDGEDDALLEPDESDEDDVSGIIDTDIVKDER